MRSGISTGSNSSKTFFIALVVILLLPSAGCNQRSPGETATSLGFEFETGVCSNDMLSPQQILSVKRDPDDAPLASLEHYAPRNAPRAADAVLNGSDCETNTSFLYATGLGDITGPAADASMSGYVDPNQVSIGLLNRQRARAFIIQSDCGNRSGRVALVQMDIGLAFNSIRQGVLDELAQDSTLAALYTDDNIVLNASHSHGTAAGQSHHDAFHVLTNGHDPQSYAAAVSGVVNAIRRAHANLQNATPGPILFNQGELLNGTVQRSLPAFIQNPEAERQQFVDTRGEEVRTNRMMTMLKMVRDDGRAIGMLNWYPIHGTSMSQLNELLAGDNKGYAAYRFEQDFDTDYFASEQFLAGFVQGDEGDASPNLFIPDLSEAELRNLMSDGFQNRAGGRDDAENALISGFKQYRRARELYDSASEQLTGEVTVGQFFLDMSGVIVDNPQRSYPAELQPVAGEEFQTCKPALGVSFAGGAEDGRGPSAEGQTCSNTSNGDVTAAADFLAANFEAGMNGALPPGAIVPVGCDNLVYDNLGYACHAEKPIIFPVGEVSPFNQPGGMQTLEPLTQKVQMVVIGNLAIIALPWEVTTVAGRRLRTSVLDVLEDAGVDYAVIAGLSNGYIHYLTTREEYSVQQYEGASTVYGPWAQEAVEQELIRLATQLRNGDPASTPFPDADFRSELSTLVNPAGPDDGNPSGVFGDVVQQPEPEYQIGDDVVVVTASFIAGHPRNDLKLDSSYLFIERMDANGAWIAVATDDDWFTRFEYQPDQDQGNYAVVQWIVPPDAEPGRYRIRHEGVSGQGAYSGTSQHFELLACEN